jgi:glutathione synthase/RimK-type ligase-like ATP-grasp enzyme
LTVLVFSQFNDIHADRLCSSIIALGESVFRINSEDVLNLTIEFSNYEFTFRLFEKEVNSKEIKSVFLRRKPNSRDFGVLSDALTAPQMEYISLQREALFLDAFFSLYNSARFYNKLDSIFIATGKGGQSKIARDAGFDCSPMIVGSSNFNTTKFIETAWNQSIDVCSKPLSGKFLESDGNIFTRYTEMISRKTEIYKEDFETCPLIFQLYVEKDYEIRITVIDNLVMPIRIDSQLAPDGTKIDWRKYNIPQTPHSIIDVPRSLEEKILNFHNKTGLRFSAFDFIFSKDGKYVFLETNPSGQWLWLEELTGFPITQNIAKKLCES